MCVCVCVCVCVCARARARRARVCVCVSKAVTLTRQPCEHRKQANFPYIVIRISKVLLYCTCHFKHKNHKYWQTFIDKERYQLQSNEENHIHNLHSGLRLESFHQSTHYNIEVRFHQSTHYYTEVRFHQSTDYNIEVRFHQSTYYNTEARVHQSTQ